MLHVDLEEAAARVTGVQLHDAVVLAIVLDDLAHAEGVDASLDARMVVALEDDHVAAVAVAALEVAAAGGALADRGDDLDELVAGRDHGVAQSEDVDAGIVVRRAEGEDVGERVDDRVEVVGDECDLSESEHLVRVPLSCR